MGCGRRSGFVILNSHGIVKPKFKERQEIFWSVSLNRDDLEHIIALMRQSCQEVVVSDKTHEYDTLDEVLETAGPHPKELNILGVRPHVDLDLRRGGSKITYAEVGDKRDGPERPGEDLFFRIKDFLSRRKHFMAKAPGVFLIPIALLGGLACIVESQKYAPQSYIAIALAIVGISLIFGGGAIATFVKGVARLSVAQEGTESNFWSRNKDKIFMLLVGALISEIIHIVSALLQKK
jgi:hypothetical protein